MVHHGTRRSTRRARGPLLRALGPAALVTLVMGSAPVRGQDAGEKPEGDLLPICETSCRGLGFQKVKVADGHCGFVSRERKNSVLDAAALLAEDEESTFRKKARKSAEQRCKERLDDPACRCKGEYRPWENVFTHVFSQKCWAESGWAYVVRCREATEPPEARGESEREDRSRPGD